MLDRLPTELALRVLQAAASELWFTDRSSVVNLALTSRLVYDIVTPILYNTLIASKDNINSFAQFTYDDVTRACAKRVCSHVHVLADYNRSNRAFNLAFFTNVIKVFAAGTVVRDLANFQCQTADLALREVTIESIDFRAEISWIPQRSRQFITHATGFLPVYTNSNAWREFFSSRSGLGLGPDGWTSNIIGSLPALTHFALVLEATEANSGGINVFDLGSLPMALKTALEFSRLEMVVLKVVGVFAEHRKEVIEELVRDIQDPRVSLLVEHRTMDSWDRHHEWSIEDIVAGRDIWTRVRSMYAVNHPTPVEPT